MKKTLYVCMALSLAVLTWSAAGHGTILAKNKHLTGCSAKGTVSFMFWGDKGEDKEQTADIKAAEKACPGLHVNADWDQGNYDNDLATKIGSGNAPDVFQLDAEKRLPEYVTQGALTNLTSYAKHDKINMSKTFWSQCASQAVYEGKIWGLPRDCGNQGMLLYNIDMFKARHVALPTTKWTYKDLMAAAVKLSGNYSLPTDPTSTLRFGISLNTDDYRINQYMWDWGGNWIINGKCGLTNSKSQAALQWWYNLAAKYHGAPTASQATTAGDYVSGFAKQHYAMTFAGPWALDYIVKPSAYTGNKPVPFHWGVTYNPMGPKSRAALDDAALEVVSAHAKNKTAAWWLVKFLTMGAGGALEGKYGIGLPGDKNVAESSSVKSEYAPYSSIWYKGIQLGRSLVRVPSYDAFWDKVSTDLNPFWQGTESVQKATATACADAKPYIP